MREAETGDPGIQAREGLAMRRGLIKLCIGLHLGLAALALAGRATALSQVTPATRADTASRPTPKIMHGEGWAIAAPDDWGTFAGVRPPMVLYLVGDNCKGIPPLDGTLAALKAGLTVEVHPRHAGLSPKERAERDLKGLRSAEGFEIQGEHVIEDTVLADGAKAQRVRVAILRP